MNERYNILWIDDQYAELSGFIDEAYSEGFDITPFSSSCDGMAFLESNLSAVDALILDAKVFKKGPEDVPSEKGLFNSLFEIARISGKSQGKEIPYVVFTGQPDLESDAVFADRLNGASVFSKNQDTTPLFDKLRELIGDSPNATVRNQYRAAYHSCCQGRINSQCWKLLAPVLRSITYVEDLPTDPYNDVRKALEWVFRYLHDHCVIHEKLIDDTGRVNLQGISHFLAGNKVHLKLTNEYLLTQQPILPKLLADSTKFILDVTQPGSHTEQFEYTDTVKSSIEAVKEHAPGNHLIQIVAIMTADFAVWATNYVAAHPDAHANRALWTQVEDSLSGDDECIECEGLVDGIDSYGNWYVITSHIPETRGKNVRIVRSLIDKTGMPLSKGLIVSTSSADCPDKKYRNAIKYHILPTIP